MVLDKNFLLENEIAKGLFHKFAKHQPIVDYHCHLDTADLLENKQYKHLNQVWLNDKGAGDHYKWRLMRANGIEEELISGPGDDYEKFLAFVKTVEKAPGNPIFEWSHLELQRYFDIDLTISEKNAPEIWRRANEKIQTDSYRPKELLEMMDVKAICTTDDPTDDLGYHTELSKQDNSFKVLPTFRPDKVWSIKSSGFSNYILKLSQAAAIPIKDFNGLKQALSQRVDHFHQIGCRLADHGLNTYFYEIADEKILDNLLIKALAGKTDFHLSEIAQFVTGIQLHLMSEYTRYGWTMQMHLNALRNNSSILKEQIGVDVGGDSMGDQASLTQNVVALFDTAEKSGCLPKTILYSLNPTDWLPLATAMQSFQGGMIQKIQLGCAWWFNDTAEGMRQQLTTMAQQSLLSNFTGMLTDSRSFLSYPRHEYFRRVLCQLLSEWVKAGRIPDDEMYLSQIVENICYRNAYNYFNFFEIGSRK
ncbi:glucuronate isomerase [Enterococcus faecium]|nr:glucuronate isomerase [Enterococcus faecium]